MVCQCQWSGGVKHSTWWEVQRGKGWLHTKLSSALYSLRFLSPYKYVWMWNSSGGIISGLSHRTLSPPRGPSRGWTTQKQSSGWKNMTSRRTMAPTMSLERHDPFPFNSQISGITEQIQMNFVIASACYWKGKLVFHFLQPDFNELYLPVTQKGAHTASSTTNHCPFRLTKKSLHLFH